MSNARRCIQERVRRSAARAHVATVPVGVAPFAGEDPAGITHAVPVVRVDWGGSSFRGRRKRIRFEDGARAAVLLARTRTVPRLPIEGAVHVEHGVGARGARRPVACADPGHRTIHVLVDLRDAEIVESHDGDPAAVICGSLFEGPLRAVLGRRDDPTVGDEVPDKVLTLLENRRFGRRELARRELGFLRRMLRGAGDDAPRPLQLRLEIVEREARKERKAATKLHARREVRRLHRLVSSRACGMLHFGDDRVRGLLSPRALDEAWWIGPVMFELYPDGRRGAPSLRVWNPADPKGHSLHPCLGAAFEVLPRMSDDGDIYGLVDTVLNFVETNRIGAAPFGEWPAFEDTLFPF